MCFVTVEVELNNVLPSCVTSKPGVDRVGSDINLGWEASQLATSAEACFIKCMEAPSCLLFSYTGAPHYEYAASYHWFKLGDTMD